MAMQGFAADPEISGGYQAIASAAVAWADALLAELAKAESEVAR
jgi:hypothetical protein